MSTEITTAAVETLALHLQEYWARSARRREPIIWADLARDILALIGEPTALPDGIGDIHAEDDVLTYRDCGTPWDINGTGGERAGGQP